MTIMPDVIRDEAGGATAEAVRDLWGMVRTIQRDSSKSVTVFEGTGARGGVRIGAPSSRGNALDKAPEVFIQVDIPNGKVSVFVTIPLDSSLTTWDWLFLNGRDIA